MQIRPRSLMDRMRDCGSCDPSSILGGGTCVKMTGRSWSFSFVYFFTFFGFFFSFLCVSCCDIKIIKLIKIFQFNFITQNKKHREVFLFIFDHHFGKTRFFASGGIFLYQSGFGRFVQNFLNLWKHFSGFGHFFIGNQFFELFDCFVNPILFAQIENTFSFGTSQSFFG